jgi:hypothetical protein
LKQTKGNLFSKGGFNEGLSTYRDYGPDGTLLNQEIELEVSGRLFTKLDLRHSQILCRLNPAKFFLGES